MCVYGARIAEVVVIPDVVQNLLPRERYPLIFEKIAEQLEFLKAEIDTLSVHADFVGALVEAYAGNLYHDALRIRRGAL